MAIDNIHTSGGIFTHHFIESLQQDTLTHKAVRPEAFTLPGHDRVTEGAFDKAVASAWESLVERWDKVEREFGSYDISALRQQWLRPLSYHLNINLEYQRGDTVLEGDLRFPVSHLGRAGVTEFTLPFHSVLYTAETSLETRVGSGRGIKNLAPHDMLQRYLNLSKEHDWAIATDGVYLRLLRDFHHTYTRGYVEFDLQGIFSSRDFAGFRAMYRLLHASRFVVPEGKEAAAVDELYEDSLAMGVRVGEDLRENVQEAIESLANGFLTSSPGFLDQVHGPEDGAAHLYRDVLMTIYRMLFLLFAEQRGMLPGRGSIYMEEFSLTAFRTQSEQPLGEDRNIDLWEKFKTTIEMVEHGVEELGIYPYNGALFSLGRTPLLTPQDQHIAPTCRNDHFLITVKHLTTVEKNKVLQRISYADLSVEEIGSIYESLLEFTPRISDTQLEVENRPIQANTFFLDPRGSGRKTTGSYYTPPSLVNELIKSALVPVMNDRIQAVIPGYDYEYTEALTNEERQAAEEAILKINVVDPAAGSGAFLIAANNKLALELARIRTGDLFPSDIDIRHARRDVLAHCIYAVDLNPMAVELCKVSLWINAAVEDAPLNFLDHHIKCGNSLVGATPALIADGIPDKAYNPVTGDDKELSKAIKAQNRVERKGQMSLVRVTPIETKQDLQKWRKIDRLAETDPNQAEAEYLAYWGSNAYWDKRLPYDLWTAAFFIPLTERYHVPTTQDVRQSMISPVGVPEQIKKHTVTLAIHYRFFQWHLEFPQIFDDKGNGGFDIVLGNPPWERVKLQEKEFYEGKDEAIAKAPNAATRKKLINRLPRTNPALWDEFQAAIRGSESTSKFLRNSGAYPLTGRGDINLYQVFAGKSRQLIGMLGWAGIIIPTGIATDDTNKYYFADLIETAQLASLFDFENRKALFPGVHRSYKFCLLTLRSAASNTSRTADFAFFLFHPEDLTDIEKVFKLSAKDFNLLNPNTKTCPIFRSRTDAALTRKLYQTAPVMINEKMDENTWGLTFSTMFHMANDSSVFSTREGLDKQSFELHGNIFVNANNVMLPLYEGRMIHHFDHRYSSVGTQTKTVFRSGVTIETQKSEHRDPCYTVLPRYWVDKNNIKTRVNRLHHNEWFIGFRDVTSATNERTFVGSILPFCGVGHKIPLLFTSKESIKVSGLVSNLSSFILDYTARQKLGGVSLTYFVIKQLPVHIPDLYTFKLISYIIPRVMELTYTAWDLKAFADDLWREIGNHALREAIVMQWQDNVLKTNGGITSADSPEWLRYMEAEDLSKPFPYPPFLWSDDRRFQLRCELDALYGHLYNLTREEFDYLLETFSIVKRKDEEKYGEYRTKIVILENFDNLADDPMFEGVCVPLSERVSVLERPEKAQPQVHITTRPIRIDNEIDSISEKPITKHSESNPKNKNKPPKPKTTPENQQIMFDESTDFSATQTNYGLYKCKQCGKIVVGFSMNDHNNDVHGGKDPGYEILR